MTTRRRFLALTAAALAAPGLPLAAAAPVRWRGLALGAPASIEIRGAPGPAEAALRDVVGELRRLERALSLHEPGSALSRLNREGELPEDAAGLEDVLALLHASLRYEVGSSGLFTPFVQPLWRALAEGRTLRDPGWTVQFSYARVGRGLRLDAGKALTFNGMAQGHVADRLTERLAAHGFGRVLVDTGEIRAAGGPWRVGLEDPSIGRHGWLTLEGSAVATSSPGAMRLADGGPHIVAPGGPRRLAWSSVTVEAPTARHADACSTALAMTRDRGEAEAMAHRLGDIRRVVLVDIAGDVSTIRGTAVPPA